MSSQIFETDPYRESVETAFEANAAFDRVQAAKATIAAAQSELKEAEEAFTGFDKAVLPYRGVEATVIAELEAEITPEQQEEIAKVKTALAERFKVDETDFVEVIAEQKDGQVKPVVVYGAQYGLYQLDGFAGNFSDRDGEITPRNVFSRKNNDILRVKVGRKSYDTRLGMTKSVFNALYTKALLSGEPLPDYAPGDYWEHKESDEELKKVYLKAGSLLTGEDDIPDNYFKNQSVLLPTAHVRGRDLIYSGTPYYSSYYGLRPAVVIE